MLFNSPIDLIGNTPIVRLSKISKKYDIQDRLFGKLEYFNLSGSVKDRAAVYMIKEAKESGRLAPGGTIIEPTSGNTGIGLAAVGKALGYNVIITMPDTMSTERRKMMKAYGAGLVLTPGTEGMAGAVKKAEELQANIPGSIIAGQFENPANPRAHYNTTGPEIWKDMGGNVDVFIAGVGTGGTISGVGKYLKERNPNIRIIAVEPYSSPLLSEGKAGYHKIQGIGANFIPKALDKNIYDEIITVKNEEAMELAAEMGIVEGILVGISSGAALYGAIKVANREENKEKNIVVILPDGGDRYLSTDLYRE